MARTYTTNLTPTAYSAATDLIEFAPAANIPIEILTFRVWQTTELGDAAEEQLTVSWVRGNTTSGSGGASGTSVPANPRDAAAATTVEVGNTTQASGGTPVTVYSTGWNVRAPLEVVLTPETYIRCDAGQTLLVLRIPAPADSTTIGASVTYREI